jgi:SAM-dependent methyltransferase
MPEVISDAMSQGVQAENVANRKLAGEHRAFLDACSSLKAYLSPSLAPKEYEPIMRRCGHGRRKILDIGAGRGESSLYLASLDHQVFALEPSEDFCALMESASRKFNTPLTVVRGVAEDLDKLGYRDFDLVFYNSSLHHCDEPVRALRHCYNLMKAGASIILSAELHIRPWVTKRRFNIRLEHEPGAMGHYGGNEHPYYNWEYLSMLRQVGFAEAETFPLATASDPQLRLGRILRGRGGPDYTDAQIAARAVVYTLTAKLVKSPLLFTVISRCSLLPCQFRATKPLHTTT